MGVHVVSKLDNRQHASFDLDIPAQRERSDSSVSIRTQLISLTSNNLTYARMGGLLRWWDAYPVSEDYPAPYNDPSAWGIVPAWGYATVEETTIPELPKGTLLYGFWPTTSTLTDLKLKRGSPEGHWIETSDHRQQLMPLYNRYTVAPTSNSISDLTTALNPLSDSAQNELDRLAWTTLFIGGLAGFVLSEYVFSSDPNQPPIHPLGNQAGLQWTLSDGDLSSAVVVNLAASTKTARVFSSYVSRKPNGSAPLGLLQVTSAVSRIEEADRIFSTSVPSKVVGYGTVGSRESAEWLASWKPSKIVIMDFGGRGNSLHDTLSLIKNHAELQSCKVVTVQVGSEQKVYSTEETIAGRAAVAELGKVLFNTSGVQDTILESVGAEAYFATKSAQWEKWLDVRHLSEPGMKIVFGSGVSGAGGVEGGWERLCHGQVGAEEGLVYKVQ
ncbi:hypothetical protein Pdw03_5209 [Penicillium digitatum]|uniref:Uncharacterized protein n=3 Tax=Penicillium digitatum TaxID=36651 RepID=K9F566_PEND2|nr:hypothetical protein PDIP_03380 [Penicillium digitatum Pd1]EKV04415.1 hypothetical protein PDIG_89110 [Penicillium digitatum PHI26]EKV21747.1 hypothetical protein PDIP_03380 [Penicillium digitatum Pd1]QQK47574.1 hypothetical protein Pdw03_5209 [Penicillium digitatum]